MDLKHENELLCLRITTLAGREQTLSAKLVDAREREADMRATAEAALGERNTLAAKLMALVNWVDECAYNGRTPTTTPSPLEEARKALAPPDLTLSGMRIVVSHTLPPGTMVMQGANRVEVVGIDTGEDDAMPSVPAHHPV